MENMLKHNKEYCGVVLDEKSNEKHANTLQRLALQIIIKRLLSSVDNQQKLAI